ncbi:MAG: hypothetical protein IE911_11475, partial [Brevundimonas sp.]|nr:hypothetical protein [Brevundimonas sp.]
MTSRLPALLGAVSVIALFGAAPALAQTTPDADPTATVGSASGVVWARAG